ncbi:hypothetical protein CDAR_402751 [Caerostris darwini]|uniref:Uncharacterized protein n=1 Tax=Caerostris darwini TaxID=1538125 RepID=A0AAV4N301_9ARAC|nr:hypothetical protein CDAR_402751 [Caerostris darwini]
MKHPPFRVQERKINSRAGAPVDREGGEIYWDSFPVVKKPRWMTAVRKIDGGGPLDTRTQRTQTQLTLYSLLADGWPLPRKCMLP